MLIIFILLLGVLIGFLLGGIYFKLILDEVIEEYIYIKDYEEKQNKM